MRQTTPIRSFRASLVGWFLLVSLLPTITLSVYFLLELKTSVNREVANRLNVNSRELDISIQELNDSLDRSGRRIAEDTSLTYNLATQNSSSLRESLSELLRTDLSSTLGVYDSEGTGLVFLNKQQSEEGLRRLEEKDLKAVRNFSPLLAIQSRPGSPIQLRVVRQILSKSDRILGFLEQQINLDKDFMAKMRSRMNIEYLLVNNGGTISNSTLIFASMESLLARLLEGPDFLEYSINGMTYGFISHQLWWGKEATQIYLGVDKLDSDKTLTKITHSLLVLLAVLVVLFGLLISAVTSAVNKPILALVAATRRLHLTEGPIEIPVSSNDEFGILSSSFNEMSQRMLQSKSDLKAKIRELEETNDKLNRTQEKLVHSAKMASLGQLVAGVAHELNNPIGFIYSNMTHLRGYSEKLIEYAAAVTKTPDQTKNLQKQFDIEYIQNDLPRLVASCEEGAKRTRDIVLGLRTFSHSDGEEVAEIDLNASLDLTLDILKGELKGRIEVKRNFQNPCRIQGLSTQINQVLLNIISNASQAIEKTGIIWIRTKSLTKQGSLWVEVSIQDNGLGMDEATLAKIFDPFFTTKPVGQGTGLGLSISYGIIARHSGELQVKSKLGTGTEFKILLPTRYTPAQHPLQSDSQN